MNSHYKMNSCQLVPNQGTRHSHLNLFFFFLGVPLEKSCPSDIQEAPLGFNLENEIEKSQRDRLPLRSSKGFDLLE